MKELKDYLIKNGCINNSFKIYTEENENYIGILIKEGFSIDIKGLQELTKMEITVSCGYDKDFQHCLFIELYK